MEKLKVPARVKGGPEGIIKWINENKLEPGKEGVLYLLLDHPEHKKGAPCFLRVLGYENGNTDRYPIAATLRRLDGGEAARTICVMRQPEGTADEDILPEALFREFAKEIKGAGNSLSDLLVYAGKSVFSLKIGEEFDAITGKPAMPADLAGLMAMLGGERGEGPGAGREN